jgi:isochorismate synthase
MLIYRFPGQEIIQKTGCFQLLESEIKEGFIVSNFDGSEKYIFSENQTDSEIKILAKEIQSVSKADYLFQGTKLVAAIRHLGIQKTVLSRVLIQEFDTLKTLDLFHLLEQNYPKAFIYCFSDENLGTWLGASPEILLQQFGNSGFTIALASTKKQEDNSDWNEKEKLEQAFVSEFIEEQLFNIGINQIEKNGPNEHIAGPIKHLRTDFSFSLDGVSIHQIISSLHPTPAVSGLPQNLSLDLIKSLEKHNRELYAGFIGLAASDKASFFVNLRCCQVTKGKINLYVGGGYTKDSNPEMEWQETENKSRTILNLVEKL